MLKYFIVFLLGCFTGAFIGIFLLAILSVNKEGDDDS